MYLAKTRLHGRKIIIKNVVNIYFLGLNSEIRSKKTAPGRRLSRARLLGRGPTAGGAVPGNITRENLFDITRSPRGPHPRKLSNVEHDSIKASTLSRTLYFH